jgi:hypothetical protein
MEFTRARQRVGSSALLGGVSLLFGERLADILSHK